MQTMARGPRKVTQFSRELGARILAARNRAGLTQTALATALGSGDQTVIAHWEAGRQIPSAQSLTALARALNVSADYLLGLEE